MSDQQFTPELLAKAKRGDREAFDDLVSLSADHLTTFVRRRIRSDLRDRLDIDGLVNDTFGRAFSSLSRFDGDEEDVWFGWLAGIAKNVALKELEQLRRGRTLQLDRDPPDNPPSPSRAMRREERFGRLREAVDQLAEDHREVVRLCRLEGLSVRDAAARMKRTPEAVKMLLSRGL